MYLTNTYFNPRLREGGDQDWMISDLQLKDFNPRLREGGDLRNFCVFEVMQYFNPRLREGGDLTAKKKCIAIVFQSTPPRRRRRNKTRHLREHIDFNPRLREGGDLF